MVINACETATTGLTPAKLQINSVPSPILRRKSVWLGLKMKKQTAKNGTLFTIFITFVDSLY